MFYIDGSSSEIRADNNRNPRFASFTRRGGSPNCPGAIHKAFIDKQGSLVLGS